MEDIRNKVFDKERFNIDKERLKIIHCESPKEMLSRFLLFFRQ